MSLTSHAYNNSQAPQRFCEQSPWNEEEYNRLVSLLDDLIDEVGEDENHVLASLMEIIGVLIEHYEAQNVPELGTE